ERARFKRRRTPEACRSDARQGFDAREEIAIHAVENRRALRRSPAASAWLNPNHDHAVEFNAAVIMVEILESPTELSDGDGENDRQGHLHHNENRTGTSKANDPTGPCDVESAAGDAIGASGMDGRRARKQQSGDYRHQGRETEHAEIRR